MVYYMTYITSLLYCISPSVGNTHVHAAGNNSLSARFTYCCTSAESNSVVPLSAADDTTVSYIKPQSSIKGHLP